MIYVPKGRAREYGELACNVYLQCTHGCSYCYCPDSLHISKEEFHHEPTVRPAFLDGLSRDAERIAAKGMVHPVFLSFIGDCYQPVEEKLGLTRYAIKILHRYGVPVMLLTKGGERALRDFGLLGPGDSFGVTLTCPDEETSRLWEPKAAPPAERLATLQEARRLGIQTWVSCEPVLEPDWTFHLIRRAAPFTDLFRVGKANHMPLLEATIDWRQFGLQVEAFLKSLGAKYVLKNDLRRAMA